MRRILAFVLGAFVAAACRAGFHRWAALGETIVRIDAFTNPMFGTWPGGWAWQRRCHWCGRRDYAVGLSRPKRIHEPPAPKIEAA